MDSNEAIVVAVAVWSIAVVGSFVAAAVDIAPAVDTVAAANIAAAAAAPSQEAEVVAEAVFVKELSQLHQPRPLDLCLDVQVRIGNPETLAAWVKDTTRFWNLPSRAIACSSSQRSNKSRSRRSRSKLRRRQ